MPELIHILLAVALILSAVVIVIALKLAGLADLLFITEQQLTGHINKMGDALNGHHHRWDCASDSIGHLDERLKRVEALAFAPAETILDLTTSWPEPEPTMTARQAHTAELIEHLNALQKEFEQDGATFSYQLAYHPRK